MMFNSRSPAVLNNHAVLLESTNGANLPPSHSYLPYIRSLPPGPNSHHIRKLTTLQKTLYTSLTSSSPVFHYALAKALQPIPEQFWEEGVKEVMELLTSGMKNSRTEEERIKGERMVEDFVVYVDGVENGGKRKKEEKIEENVSAHVVEEERKEELKTIEKLDSVLEQLKTQTASAASTNNNHVSSSSSSRGENSDTLQLRYELESLREEMRRLTSSISTRENTRETTREREERAYTRETPAPVQEREERKEEKVEVRRIFGGGDTETKPIATGSAETPTPPTPPATPATPEPATTPPPQTSQTPSPPVTLYIPTPTTPPPPSPQITSLLNVANAYIDKSQYHPATLQFKKIIKKQPHHLGSRIGLATFLEKQGKESVEEWCSALKVAKDVGDSKVDLLWEKVKSLISEGVTAANLEVVKSACWSVEMVEEIKSFKILEEEKNLGKKKKGNNGTSSGGIMNGGGVGTGSSVFQQHETTQPEPTEDPLNKLEEGAKVYEQR
ncbi:hypothetical protein TrLO_g8426 [Triparma laevis f. longispina]|uniref:Uncharacterized protein n=1 Tax=Triparma laevis f. longispina TaxID=1714387 RepID=A0A9W7ABT0_9STRA|nr:hypothetical protein TrLO_g8426 [Triparma laevis f. longispina]